jgi:hypothetical protein
MSHKLIIATAFATALTGVAYAQQPKPATDVTPRSSVLTTIPSNATTVTTYYKQNVYDPSDSKIGEIVDVLVGNEARSTPSSFRSVAFSEWTPKTWRFHSTPFGPPTRMAHGT